MGVLKRDECAYNKIITIGNREVVEARAGVCNRFVLVHGWVECVDSIGEDSIKSVERAMEYMRAHHVLEYPESRIPSELNFINGCLYPLVDYTNTEYVTILNHDGELVTLITTSDDCGNQIPIEYLKHDRFKGKTLLVPIGTNDDTLGFRIPIGCDIQWVC